MTTVRGDSSDLDSRRDEADGSGAEARTDGAESATVASSAAESAGVESAGVESASAESASAPAESASAGATSTDAAAPESTSIPERGEVDSAVERVTDAGVGPDDDPADLSVIVLVPAYNEADTVAEVVRDAKAYADDVVVIDDDSDDDTGAVAREVADGVVTHPTNLGVGAALHTGYRLALREGYDVIVQLDADGQHDPAYIPEMVERLTGTDAGMVVGSRWLNSSHEEYPPLRRLGIRFFTLEANLLGGVDVTDITSGYRVYDASLLAELGRPANGHWALEQTLEVARNGHDIEEVSVRMPPESEGSQFDLETYAKYPARMVLTTLKVLLFR